MTRIALATAADLLLKADLASPALTGSPTVNGLRIPGVQYARRATDASPVNNSTTLVADDTLTLPLVANGVYEVRAHLKYDASQVADFAFAWSGPAGWGFDWEHVGLTLSATGTSTSVNRQAFSGATQSSAGGPQAGGGQNASIFVFGLITNGANAGSITLKWAQGSAEATNTVLKAGSFLIVGRLA